MRKRIFTKDITQNSKRTSQVRVVAAITKRGEEVDRVVEVRRIIFNNWGKLLILMGLITTNTKINWVKWPYIEWFIEVERIISLIEKYNLKRLLIFI